MVKKVFTYLGVEVILFSLYLAAAYWGLQMHAVNNFASLLWIPSGLSLAFLLIYGLKYWPAITAAAAIANHMTGAPIPASMAIGIGNTLEPLAGAYLLSRVTKLNFSLEHVNDILRLIFFGAVLSTLISATVGTVSLWLSGAIVASSLDETFLAWWAGDAISILVVSSAILTWYGAPIRLPRRRQALELASLVLVLIAVSEIIFGYLGFVSNDERLRSYLIFPVFVWIALRFNQRITTSSVIVFSTIAVWNTLHGAGIYKDYSIDISLFIIQVFVAVLSTTAMILTAAISERKIQERQKDEFISVASHELKTPLTSMKALTQTMQILFEKKGDQQSSSHMRHVNRQLERLNRLVYKMLDLTRIQEGKITLQKERFAIGPLIREIAQEVVETTHHEIVIKGDKRTIVLADRDRIGRVLTNLMSNAAKYSPKSDKIIVDVLKTNEEVVVGVRDFGIGISKSDQKHIFERFFQSSHAKASNRKQSLGLGLFIAKEIMDRHGGRIWVESKTGGNRSGSTFYFALPTNLNES